MGEKCKVSIRNIRREANDELKTSKDKEISEDEIKKEKIIQDYTDNQIKIIEDRYYQKKRNNDNMNSPKHVTYGWKW